MLNLYVFLIGTILTSFYMVVATRLPNKESIVKPRSHCDNCNHILSWYELIPILSYIIVRGKCPKCKNKISISYPVMELIGGILFLLSFITFNISYNFYLSIILSSLLIIIIISDFKYFIIFDSVLFISELLIIIINILYNKNILITLSSGLIMFIIMLLIKFIGDLTFKRESLGGGDIKLMFIIGSILGLKLSIISIIISSFTAFFYALYSLYILKKDEIPFGPFLVFGTLITYFFSSDILAFLNFLSTF